MAGLWFMTDLFVVLIYIMYKFQELFHHHPFFTETDWLHCILVNRQYVRAGTIFKTEHSKNYNWRETDLRIDQNENVCTIMCLQNRYQRNVKSKCFTPSWIHKNVFRSWQNTYLFWVQLRYKNIPSSTL